MRNTCQTFAKRYPKIVVGISIVTLVVLIMSFMVYDKSATQTNDESIKHYKPENLNSISMINGECKINYDFIKSNKNKQTLLNIITTEVLKEKHSKTEIPAFILTFMESLSENNKFEMANPGEPWYVNDIMGFTLSKMYDSQKKDTVDIVTPSQKILPHYQFVYFGISKNMALLSYYSGGLRMSQNVVMLHFKNNKIIDFWCNNYIDMKASTKAAILERLMNEGGC